TSVIDCTSLIAAARIAGSSASGMPALTSSMCAPAATCARASASTRLKSPAAISAASSLRPVGLMRSPMMTNGRSKPITTSLVAELMTVSVIYAILSRSSGGLCRAPLLSVPHDAGGLDDLVHELFLTIGHHMHARYAFDLFDLLDQIDRQ